MNNPLTAADTHVHIYPLHDAVKCMEYAAANFSTFAPGDSSLTRLICLTERHDCHFFRETAENVQARLPGFELRTTDEPFSLYITSEKIGAILMLAGRQIISEERIEVLALGRDLEIPDGLPVEKVLETVQSEGALPVLSWAPGKWFFERGNILQRIIRDSQPSDFLLGDTTLRPVGWRTPRIMAEAAEKGFKVICGTDPLPFQGEELVIGQFGTLLDASPAQNQPGQSVMDAIKHSSGPLARFGKRNPVPAMLRRLYLNSKSKRCTSPAD